MMPARARLALVQRQDNGQRGNPQAGSCGAREREGVVEPINDLQQAQVKERTMHFIEAAQALFGREFKSVPVLFDLRGRSAGMFKVYGRERWIRYNPWIFAKYFDVNLRDTVPHEVAHFVVHELYGRRRVLPHGEEWQAVMAAFGADPGVTFDLDLSGIPQRRQNRHRYHCGCREHQVTTTRHNRIQSKAALYQCRSCGGTLRYAASVG
tara:strand:- start:249812 stop:250438 length:627 start_codon:yes stop_codon:yes gene_type:complete